MRRSGTCLIHFPQTASTDILQTRFLILASLLLAAMNPVAATEEIEHIIVTATRRAVDASDIPASVATADAESVTTAKLATDALRDVVGVHLQQTTPGQGAAIIRGLKGSAVLHLVDGMRLSNVPHSAHALVRARANHVGQTSRGNSRNSRFALRQRSRRRCGAIRIATPRI